MIHYLPTGEYQIVKYELDMPYAHMIMAIYENDTFWYHFHECMGVVFFIGGQHRKKCCGS